MPFLNRLKTYPKMCPQGAETARLFGVAVLFCLAVMWAWYKARVIIDDPIACDPFGYLLQAKLFIEHGFWAGLHTGLHDPTTSFLMAIVKTFDSSIDLWGFVPYAHHYDAVTNQIILQYPPGTGFFFSLFPEGLRNRSAVQGATFGLAVFTASLFLLSRLRLENVGFIALAAYLQLSFLVRLHEPLSTAVTAGLLPFLAMILMLNREEGLSWSFRLGLASVCGFLVGVLVDVRVANILLSPGVAICLCWNLSPRRKGEVLGLCALGGLAGLIPFLLANKINAGGWLSSTYASHDASAPILSLTHIMTIAEAYLDNRKVMGLFVLSLVGLIWCWRRARGEAMAMLAVLAVSLPFFLTHRFATYYYLYPTLAFCLLLAMGGVARAERMRDTRRLRFLYVGSLILPLVCFVALALQPPQPYTNLPKPTQTEAFREGIVWAERSGGRFIYYLDIQAQQLNPLKPEPRRLLIQAIQREDRAQYFIDDGPVMASLIETLSAVYPLQRDGEAFGLPVYLLPAGERSFQGQKKG